MRNVHIFGQEKGPPETMVFPGLTHAIEDWEELAAHVDAPILVPENTYHTGEFLPHGSTWPKWWQQELLVILQEHPSISRIIAHSRGVVDAIRLVPLMPIMQRVTLVAPPVNGNMRRGAKRITKDQGEIHEVLMDECLSHLCPDMSDEQYEKFLRRHIRSYGLRFREIWKAESPVKSHLQEQCVHELSHLPADWNIEMVVGTEDLWNSEEELSKIQAGRPNMPIHRIDKGHFPHVSSPEQLAALLKN